MVVHAADTALLGQFHSIGNENPLRQSLPSRVAAGFWSHNRHLGRFQKATRRSSVPSQKTGLSGIGRYCKAGGEGRARFEPLDVLHRGKMKKGPR